MDSHKLLQVMVDYDPETGDFTWADFIAQDLVDLGLTSDQAEQSMTSNRFKFGDVIAPVYLSAKADYQCISFTLCGHKVRIHTGIAAWLLATGQTVDNRKDIILFRDGDVENTASTNLIYATDPAAKLLTRNYQGIETRGGDDAKQYRSLLRFNVGAVRRSVASEWRDEINEAIADRKQALIDNDLWTVLPLSTYLGEASTG